jgi:hypothetical protein
MRLTRRRLAAFLLVPIAPWLGLVAAQDGPTRPAKPTREPRGGNAATATPTSAPNQPPTATATGVPTDVPTVPATVTPVPPTEPATFTPIPTSTLTPEPPATFTPEPPATATATAPPTATATSTATATPTPGPVPVDRVLVRWYKITQSGNVDYAQTAYRPRQFVAGLAPPSGYTLTDPGPYGGFDALYPSHVHIGAATADWLTIGLNRPSRVGLVLFGPVPAFAAGWAAGQSVHVRNPNGTVQPRPTVWIDTPTGVGHVLGGHRHGVGGTGPVYWVLLAEAGGLPSGDPMPGQAPNAPCGVHPTGWHHQIDPISWCYHGHEHGTDPASLGLSWMPTFGRASAAAGMVEGNVGFKEFGWVQNGVRWMIGMHQGTAGSARLCVRHHEIAVAAWDDASGALLCDLRFMADFGRAVSNQFIQSCVYHASCPDACTAPGSNGTRQIPVIADGITGYEPWRIHNGDGALLGLVNIFLFNTIDTVKICDERGDGISSFCDLVPGTINGATGTQRFYQGLNFGLLNPPLVGEFWTDPFATVYRNPTDPDAVRQYIAPGVTDLRIATNKVFDMDGFGRRCTPSEGDLPAQPTAREGSIAPGVGPN